MSRSCNTRSTAISASLTGDDPALVHDLIGLLNIFSASMPASRTQTASSAAVLAGSMTSVAGNGHALNAQGRRVYAVAKDQVVRRDETGEHFGKMPGDGDFAHRIGALAVFDPESGSATAIIPGYQIDAHAD